MSDALSITKVCVPDARNYQLISAIKQEPGDYNDCEEALPRISAASPVPLQISSVSTIRRPSPLTSCIPSQGDLAQNISVSSSRSFGASASSRPAPLSAPDANMPTISSIAYIPPSHLPSVPSSVIPSLTPIFVSGMLPGHAISHQSESNVGALLPSLVDSVNVPASSGVLGVLNPSGYTTTPSLVRPLPPSVMQRPGAFSQILAPNTISHGFVPPTAPFLPHVFNGTAAPPGSTSLVSIAPRFPPRHENVAPRPSFHLNTVSSLPQISTQSKGHGNESYLHISPTSAFSETPLTSVVPPSSSPLSLRGPSLPASIHSESTIPLTSILYIGNNKPPTGKFTPLSAPEPNTSVAENGFDHSMSQSFVWGRVVRLNDGSLHFPGVGSCMFSGPDSVLRRIRAAALSDESLSLQLPFDALNFQLPSEALTNNWLTHTSSTCGSRTGFHVCLCCHQSFSNRALYDSHMMRPVARIFYRCHLCRGSEIAHMGGVDTTSADSNQKSFSDSKILFDPATAVASTSSSLTGSACHSPYCVVLFGGIIKASNRCAVYSHLAYAHPTEVNSWELQPSLMSVCPLSENAWGPVSFKMGGQPLTPISNEPTPDSQLPSKSDAATNPSAVDGNLVPTTGRSPPALDHSVFYRRGLELVDVWRDFELAVNYAMQLQELTVLNSPPRPIHLHRSLSPSSVLTPPFAIELDGPSPAHWSPLRRLRAPCNGSSAPLLPHPNSPLTQTILHCARSEVWHSHVFLTDSCQSCSIALDPIVIDDTVDDQEDGDSTTEVNVQRCLPPSAPSDQALQQALSFFRNQQPSGISTSSTSGGEQQPTAKSLSDPSTESSGVAPGFLRCLMCTFRTDCARQLTDHLSGSRPFVLTRCALCGQAVCLKQPNLCAVKAHLLLHLGYFLVCPHCGFTPPPYLPLDAAELCLRVHLRFVCFHFNMLQVFVCTLCHGHGKAYNSPAHLCQHIFESHTKRAYCCLWCSRQTTRTADGPASTDATVKTSTGSLHPDGSRNTDQTAGRSTSSEPSGHSPRLFLTPKELFCHIQTVHRHILTVPSGATVVERDSKQTVTPMNNTSKHSEGSTSAHASRPTTPESSTAEKGSESLLNLVPKVDFLHCHLCPECDGTFERRDAFTHHFWTTHSLSSSAVPCFRCFGTCKRLSFDLHDFRQHLCVCSIATELRAATFTASSSHRKIALKANESDKSVRETIFSQYTNESHPLCFCFHCGIGARRITVAPRFSIGGNEGAEDTSEFNGLPVDESATSDAPQPVLNGQPNCWIPSVPSDTSLTALAALKEPDYGARYFPNLSSLHTHEDQAHLTQNDSAIACPWCGHRLSCRSTRDVHFTLRHLHSHVDRSKFFAWHSERRRKWHDSVKELPHCYCGAALLDSPLAIVAHASNHLLISDPMGMAPTCSRSVAADAPKPTDPTRTPNNSIRSVNVSSCPSSRRCAFRPGPGAHVPCPVDVYRHLRFVVSPELDHYLDRALLVSRPFVCPVCAMQLTTRWALSEHAFMEHWGVLCYICCLVVVSTEPTSKPNSVTASTDPPVAASHSLAVQSAPSDVTVCAESTGHLGSPCISPVRGLSSELDQTTNLWDHVYQCLFERRKLLQSIPPPSGISNTARSAEVEPNLHHLVDLHSRRQSVVPDPSGPSSPSVLGSSPGNFIESRSPSSRSQPTVHEASRCDIDHERKKRKRLVIEDNEDTELGHNMSERAPTGDTGFTADTSSVDLHKKRHTSNSPSAPLTEQGQMMCVLCGQPQSVDTWEDHSLTHRNPRMTWSGIQLTRPQRIVLSHRQSKVYRCYLCARRFVTRFGCQRHLTGLHKLAKSRINWDSLIDTDCTRGARHSTLEASEGSDSQFTSFSQTTQSHPSAPILSWSSGDQPRSQQSLSYTMGNQQVSPPRASSDTVWLRPNTDTHTDHQQSECGGSDIHCCTICQIPFLSHRSLSIHQAAAHVSTV